MGMSSRLSVNTDTKLIDRCIKTFELDEIRLQAALQTTERFYCLDNSLKLSSFIENFRNKSNENKLKHNDLIQKQNQIETGHRFGKFKRTDENLEGKRDLGRSNAFRGYDPKRLSFAGKYIKSRKQFHRNSATPSAFIWDNLNPYFSRKCKNSLPIFGKLPSRSDIESRDYEAFAEFTKDPSILSRNMQHLLCGSCITAFSVLGIGKPTKENTNLVKPRSIRSSVSELGKNTNAGYWHFKKKSLLSVQKSTIKWLFQFLRKPTFYGLCGKYIRETLNMTGFSELSSLPVYIMHRLQISPKVDLGREFEVKIRPVWCVPYCIVALEHMFFSPMIELMKHNSKATNRPVFPIGLSNDELTRNVAFPFQRSIRRAIDRKARSFDFTRFDQSVHPAFTSFFFTIWENFLDLSDNQYLAYNALRFYTCYTPFVYKDRIMLTRRGVCSGSFTTNSRDSFVNIALIVIALRLKYRNTDVFEKILRGELDKIEHSLHDFRFDVRYGLHIIDLYDTHVYGDDGVMIEDDDFFLIHKFVCDEYGFSITYKKPVSSGESFFFLGRFWDTDGLPWQSTSYMIAHIMFRTKWYKKTDVSFDISTYLDLYRVLSICLPLRDGAKFLYDVLFEWKPFKDFVYSKKGFTLLKDYPHDEYLEINRDVAFDLSSY